MDLKLVPVKTVEDVLPRYRETPIGELFQYHAFGWPERTYAQAPLLVVACMDCRVRLRMPRTFAYSIRTAGARVGPVAFDVDYAVAVAGVQAIAVVGHDDCAMTGVTGKRTEFVGGLETKGWSRDDAGRHFDQAAGDHALQSSREAIWDEARRLEERYGGLLVAPLYALVRDGGVAQIVEG
jgi:carbonic anhydrase